MLPAALLNIGTISKAPSFGAKLWHGIKNIGVPLLSGLFSGKGVRDRNKQQMQLAREQMEFQERMSSTAHQREVADLRAAGLNPILSAGGSGASSPGGAMAQVFDEITPGINSALATKQTREMTRTAHSQRSLLTAQRNNTSNSARALAIQNEQNEMVLNEYRRNPWLRRLRAISDSIGQGMNSAVGIAAGAKMIGDEAFGKFSGKGD